MSVLVLLTYDFDFAVISLTLCELGNRKGICGVLVREDLATAVRGVFQADLRQTQPSKHVVIGEHRKIGWLIGQQEPSICWDGRPWRGES